jgi:hypothetical protein
MARLLLVGLTLTISGCDDTSSETVVPDAQAGGAGGQGGDGGSGGDIDMADVGGMGGDAFVENCTCGPDCDDAECIEPDVCEADTACRGNRICEAGACAEGCADDDACAATPEAPVCVEGRCGNCREDADCFGAATCGDSQICEAPASCSASRECVGGGICVADTLTCEPAFDCRNEGSTCPGAFECNPDNGDCRPLVDDDCESTDECAFGQVCVNGLNRCGACIADVDCGGGQTCQVGANGGACMEPLACNNNADCIGDRTCDGGLCAPPACEADAFVGNVDAETAAQLVGDQTYRNLWSCGDDWFSLDVPANTRAGVILRQHDRAVDLSLALADGEGRILRTMSSGLATERLLIDATDEARVVYLVVGQGDVESVGQYELQIDFSGADDACIDDANELGAGDDDPATARMVRGAGEVGFSGAVTGRICAGDVDFVCFEQAVAEELSVTATVTGDAVLVGELVAFGRPERIIETGRWTPAGGADNNDIEDASVAGDVYCLKLSTESGSGTYSVQLSAYTVQVKALCDMAEVLPLDGGAGSITGELGREINSIVSPQCAGDSATSGELIYQIHVDGPRLLTARVAGIGTGTLGDPVLSLRSECRVASTELACAIETTSPDDPFVPRANPVELRAALPEAGDYFIFVDGVEGGRDAQFRLDVQTSGLVAPPANDRCEDAEAVEIREGLNELEANLDQASDTQTACIGTGGADVAYAIHLDQPARLRLDALAQPDAFAVGAYLVERCGGISPTACGFGFDEVVPAGDYVLIVDGVDANAIGRVVVRINAEYFAPAPANDQCGGAVALQGASGTVAGDTRGANDDYQLGPNNACTGYASVAPDVAYQISVTAGQRTFVHAEPEMGWDLSLYLPADCDDLAGACIGHDGALGEAVVWTPAADGSRFVVVDGANGEAGPFVLTWGEAECENNAECDGGQCVMFRCVQD